MSEEAKKQRAEKRSKKQQCIDVIAKHYGNVKGFNKAKNKIETILDGLQAELELEKANKKPNVKKLVNGKSKEQIQALIDALQAEL